MILYCISNEVTNVTENGLGNVGQSNTELKERYNSIAIDQGCTTQLSWRAQKFF
jgi:hypothetical protein